MSIIISKKGVVPARLIGKSGFGKELNLQEYIHQHPEAIPVYEIQQDKRLWVAAREFDTPSGPIDALAIDQDGDIYIIETKLFENADKRRVVAQALDYGASLWKHFTDFANFILLIDRHAQAEWAMSFREKVKESFKLEDLQVESLVERMRQNLQDGNLKFVVLMDSMDERLKELITYINQKSSFDIYGVELELYEYEEYKIVIPKLYGVEGKKDSQPSHRPLLTEEELLEQIRGRNPESAQRAEALILQLKELGLYVRALPTSIAYGVNVDGNFISVLTLNSTNIWFSLPSRVIRALGDGHFVACKQIMNSVGQFYRLEDLEDPTKSSVLAPRYELLKDKAEALVSAINEVVGKVKSALSNSSTPED